MKERFEAPQSEVMEIGQALESLLNGMRNSRINPENFRGSEHFSGEEIDEDLAFVERKKEEFRLRKDRTSPENKIVFANGEILEVMWPLIIRDFDWLGQNTSIIAASTYDDMTHGIDYFAQLKEQNETYNLGMEFDFTSSIPELQDKIKGIAAKISQGKPCVMKYFDSPSTGKLKNVMMPKIAFGVSPSETSQLIEIVASAYLGKNQEPARRALREHKLKKVFIDLVKKQLQQYSMLATRADNEEYANLHNKLLERFKQRGLI